jgi:hypothetical protein
MVAGGAVLGAAAGLALATLPLAIGSTTVPAWALAGKVLFGAAMGFGIQTAVLHFAQGGSPETLIYSFFSVEALISGVIGGGIGLLFGGAAWRLGKLVINYSGRMGWLFCLKWSLPWLQEIGWQGFNIVWMFWQKQTLFSSALDWLTFRNSPPKSVGFPGWVVADTWFGARPDPRASELAPLLQTMPLAP